jgi:hypothetical protein
MILKKTLTLFCIFMLGLSSCKDQKETRNNYVQTIEDYSQVLDYAEQNQANKLNDKLEEMKVQENFHLQKIQQRHGEVELIHNCNQLLKEKKFNEARQLISEHIKKFGLSQSLENSRRTLIALENFQRVKQEINAETLSQKELIQAEREMFQAFPKSPQLNTQQMRKWFTKQKKSLAHKANQRIAKLRMVTLLQIDQFNTSLQLESKNGAEIYYHQLSRGKQIPSQEKQLANSIITLTTNTKTAPASISDLILQLYAKAPKQSIAQTLTQLSAIDQMCSLGSSIKNRILSTSLKTHGISSKDLDGPPLLNPPTLMHLILKSEQQD